MLKLNLKLNDLGEIGCRMFACGTELSEDVDVDENKNNILIPYMQEIGGFFFRKP